MPGGLLNLTSEGNNNLFLMGSPTKTFFQTTYKQHTNFGLQKFRVDYNGVRDLRLNEESVFNFVIPRHAELLLDTFVVITLPSIWSPIYQPTEETNNLWSPYEFRWIKDIGTNMIKEIEIICGNYTLQKYSGEYIKCVVERDYNTEKRDLFNRMTGNEIELYDPANYTSRTDTYPSANYTTSSVGAEPSIQGRQLYIPLNSWFSVTSKMAFPLIALQYNQLVIKVTMRSIRELYQIRDVFNSDEDFPYIQPDYSRPQDQLYRFLQTPPAEDISPGNYDNQISTWNADVHLIATYVFLSEEEARKFATEKQEYLVKDVTEYRFQNIVGTKRARLQSTGMVSSWMMYLQRSDINKRNEWSNYTNWPYEMMPFNIVHAPSTGTLIQSTAYTDNDNNYTYIGPYLQMDGTVTNIFVSGDYHQENQRHILQTMGVVLNGDYREQPMERGVYNYIEKFTRTLGNASDGIYVYNFGINSSDSTQPMGAINMSSFKTVELEVSTISPTLNVDNSEFNILCDDDGNYIGATKQNWKLYDYTYNMTVFEERYNILTMVAGNTGMMFSR